MNYHNDMMFMWDVLAAAGRCFATVSGGLAAGAGGSAAAMEDGALFSASIGFGSQGQ
jgi:hypothetical protein